MKKVKTHRLGIFCFYDKDGIVDEYVEYLLHDLVNNLEKLIIVINGCVIRSGFQIFEKYADQIVIRENKGFDAGAYCHVIVEILGEEGIKQWDEIVLCNDTFYGPFVSFEKIFQNMDGKTIDFWGIDYREGKFLSFIQSYFLVFRKSIIANGNLFRYMKECIDPQNEDITDVYAVFEVGLFSYLAKRGYKYGTYVYTENHDVYYNADRCIDEYGLPILKKKCFSPKYFSQEPLMRALYLVDKRFDYDIKYIIDNIYRLYGVKINCKNIIGGNGFFEKSFEKVVPSLIVNEEIFLKFIKDHTRLYIYGTGIIARKIWYLFKQEMDHFKGFVISDGQKSEEKTLFGYEIKKYSMIKPGSALILGVGYENSKEIVLKLRKEDKILLLWREN